MAKKYRPSSPFSGLKKTSLTSLIVVLLYTLFEMTQHGVASSSSSSTQSVVLPSSNEPVHLYANQAQDNLTRLYVSAIQDANKSIVFVIYALSDPEVIQALRNKIEQGIPVYIVCDAKASSGISKKLPGAQIVRRTGQGLMHQKILIIDDRTILAGSANMTTDSLKVHGNLVLGIDNPSLAEALTAKAKSMDEDGGSNRLLHQETKAGSQTVEFWMLPDDPGAVKRMIQLFRSAKKTIKVAMFTWTREDFTDELIQAAKRGVKVETVLDRYSGKGASAKIVKQLSEAGIPVALSTGHGLLHHKFAYIDDDILVNGSANWTHSAFKNNDDYFIVVYPLTADQIVKMNKTWQTIQSRSEPVKRL